MIQLPSLMHHLDVTLQIVSLNEAHIALIARYAHRFDVTRFAVAMPIVDMGLQIGQLVEKDDARVAAVEMRRVLTTTITLGTLSNSIITNGTTL